MKKTPILILILLLIVSCQNQKKENKNFKKSEINFKKEGNLLVKDSLKQIKAEFDIEIADDKYQRETGLMYRKEMKNNQAMLFIFEEEAPRYFYMKNTYIPLDIIYISKDSTIVNIIHNATPLDESSLPSLLPAQFVLEVKAGICEEKNLQVGDQISWIINQD